MDRVQELNGIEKVLGVEAVFACRVVDRSRGASELGELRDLRAEPVSELDRLDPAIDPATSCVGDRFCGLAELIPCPWTNFGIDSCFFHELLVEPEQA